MNKFLKSKVETLCLSIQEENYISGVFATDLNQENTIIIGITIDPILNNYNTSEVFTTTKDNIFYEFHLFYTSLNEYYNIDFNNLTDEQIYFLEILGLSDIFIDKSGILQHLKNKIINQSKKDLKL